MKSRDQIELTAHIRAPIETVWNAWTSEQLLPQWWRDDVTLQPWPGGQFRDSWRDNDGRQHLAHGQVIRADSPRILELDWWEDGWSVKTRVLVELGEDEDEDTVRLSLSHSGFATLATQDADTIRDRHEANWRHHLQRLTQFTER